MVIMSKQQAANRGLISMARIVSWAQVGNDPAIMGVAPIEAIQNAVSTFTKLIWAVKFNLKCSSLRYEEKVIVINSDHMEIKYGNNQWNK